MTCILGNLLDCMRAAGITFLTAVQQKAKRASAVLPLRTADLIDQCAGPTICSDEEAPRKEKDKKRKHKRSKKKRRDRSVAASDDDEAPRKKHRR